MLSEDTTALFIVSAGGLGLIFGIFHIIRLTQVQVGEHSAAGPHVYSQMHNDPKYLSDLIGRKMVKQIQRNPHTGKDEEIEVEGQEPYYNNWDEAVQQLKEIGKAVADGAHAFLMEEYRILSLFCLLFCIVIEFLVEEKLGEFWTVAAFALGAFTSLVSGFIGMKVAVYSNSRTATRLVSTIYTSQCTDSICLKMQHSPPLSSFSSLQLPKVTDGRFPATHSISQRRYSQQSTRNQRYRPTLSLRSVCCLLMIDSDLQVATVGPESPVAAAISIAVNHVGNEGAEVVEQ